MKKFLAICLIPVIYFSLQGCTTTAAVAGGAAGAAFSDPRSLHAQYDDKKLTYQSQRHINRHDKLRLDSHISTTTYNGIMLLVGQAPNEEARQLAERESENIEGVRKLYNRITIEPNTSMKTRTEDTWLTTKVKTALLSETNFNLRNIKVVTEDHVVYLLGLVNNLQSEKAALAASQVPGVKKVVKLFEHSQHG